MKCSVLYCTTHEGVSVRTQTECMVTVARRRLSTVRHGGYFSEKPPYESRPRDGRQHHARSRCLSEDLVSRAYKLKLRNSVGGKINWWRRSLASLGRQHVFPAYPLDPSSGEVGAKKTAGKQGTLVMNPSLPCRACQSCLCVISLLLARSGRCRSVALGNGKR